MNFSPIFIRNASILKGWRFHTLNFDPRFYGCCIARNQPSNFDYENGKFSLLTKNHFDQNLAFLTCTILHSITAAILFIRDIYAIIEKSCKGEE